MPSLGSTLKLAMKRSGCSAAAWRVTGLVAMFNIPWVMLNRSISASRNATGSSTSSWSGTSLNMYCAGNVNCSRASRSSTPALICA